MQPLVSICIPTYNSEEYIRNTILSILKQTYENIEISVVDDQSSDNTVAIIEQLQRKDNRITLYKNEQNLGMAGNWNRCLSLAKGDFIKLVCADDMIDKVAIEKEVAAMVEYPTVNLVESDTRLVDKDGKKTGVFRRYPKAGLINGKKVAKSALMIHNFFGAPVNNMVRSAALAKTGGFDAEFTYILDFDLWVRLACLGDIYIIHEVLNSFRIRNDSNTGDLINNNRKVYVAEHKKLLLKCAKSSFLKMSWLEIRLSILIRKFRNVLICVYLKIFAK
ncbi:glycosyltransferase [Lachnospiraceae bacterium ZAX-1]